MSASADKDATTTVLRVAGMTCEHCIASVTEEVGAIEGVSDVSVELDPGKVSTVTVISDRELDDQDLIDAIDEAGYSILPDL